MLWRDTPLDFYFTLPNVNLMKSWNRASPEEKAVCRAWLTPGQVFLTNQHRSSLVNLNKYSSLIPENVSLSPNQGGKVYFTISSLFSSGPCYSFFSHLLWWYGRRVQRRAPKGGKAGLVTNILPDRSPLSRSCCLTVLVQYQWVTLRSESHTTGQNWQNLMSLKLQCPQVPPHLMGQVDPRSRTEGGSPRGHPWVLPLHLVCRHWHVGGGTLSRWSGLSPRRWS